MGICNKRKLSILMAVTTALSILSTTPAYAFGEYDKGDGSSILNEKYESNNDYKAWYENLWNNNEKGEMDLGKVVLTPGKRETDLNFAWYSETKGTPQVKISKNQDMTDANVVTGEVTDIERTNQFKNYVASNKVSVSNYLEENTLYYYQYSVDGQNWSETQTYKTHSFTNYQALLVGDPQIGASGSRGQGTKDDLDIAVNTYSWNKTLQTALGENGIAKNASFILSAGDQIDYSDEKYDIREQEYTGFINPNVLRNVPIATTIGNHESKGDDYKLHYNNPNQSTLGSTNSGGDYYYSYGDALYIVLNSNNRNVEEHRQLMNEAVESHKDAKWKVVMFHHDIYGSGAPHSDVDGANLRILLAPLMDEFDIDVCLTGHDHSYARTYQIVDGKVIETEGVSENASVAYNPEGTLYIAAGSATGSKFYTLNQTKQYYLAERSNNPIPTFSTIDFTKDSMTIKTYDVEGQKYANDVTIKKDDKAVSIEEMKKTVKALDTSVMTSGSKNRVDEALQNAKNVLDTRDDFSAINELSTKWNIDSDPLNYYAYAQEGYKNEDSDALKKGYSTLLDKTLYENDSNKSVLSKEVNEAYTKLAYAKDEVVTKDEFATLQAKFDSSYNYLETINVGNKKGQYTEQNVKNYKDVLDNLKSQLKEDVLTKTQLNFINESLDNEVEKFKSSVNKEDLTITKPSDNNTTQSNSNSQNGNSQQSNNNNTSNNKPSNSLGDVTTSDNTGLIFTGICSLVALIGVVVLRVLKKKIKE